MITTRDQNILNFLEEFHVATSSQIHRLYFAETITRNSRSRLQKLTEQGFVKRTRSTINNDFAYYLERKSLLQQLHHDLIRAELYATMKQIYEILEWHNEFTIDHIRPDALTYIRNKGVVYPVLVEVHLSNQFDFDKYKMDFLPVFGVRPIVIICTDRPLKLPQIGVKFKIVGLDMSGLDTLFR